MHQTKKGNQWYFGMKIHIGADVDSGATHSVSVTAANRADISELPNLLRENDQVMFGDAGYASDEYKRGARALGWSGASRTRPSQRACPWLEQGAAADGALRQPEETQPEEFRHSGACRASVPDRQAAVRGYPKARYRGLAKNTAQVMVLIGLANLYALRRRLITA